MHSGDTIVAISSAVGAAARIIVRLSGPDSARLAEELLEGDLPAAQCVGRNRLRFSVGTAIPVTIYRFVAPHSVTAEDVIEFHLPGSVVIARSLVDHLIKMGARSAEPGEFTARAFFNGKLDLAEAEGVAAVVSAHSQAELDAARQLMAGELARRLSPLTESLADTLALVEAGIDFSDEPVSFVSREDSLARIGAIESALQTVLDKSARFEKLSHEPQVVLAGRPNAGKSTLLNALAGYDRAVVSTTAGTTRDAIGAMVRLRRGFAHVTDVAGWDEPLADALAVSPVYAQMREAAERAVEASDVIVLVRDATDDRPQLALSRAPQLVVRTKSDLATSTEFAVSAKTGAGLDELRDRLDMLCFGASSSTSGASVALTSRHVRAIDESLAALARARESVDGGAELIALELRDALDMLGTISGRVTPDDVLGRVFATFCIGK